jgi:hypothetical protein
MKTPPVLYRNKKEGGSEKPEQSRDNNQLK